MAESSTTLAGGSHAGILSPYLIFFLVLALQILQRIADRNKRKSKSKEQIQLRQEIKKLLGEATLLSTPSTFAQAAKLRRLAAAKEKELSTLKEDPVERNWFFTILQVAKGSLFVYLIWWFWNRPLVEVPLELMKPFVRVLSWTSVDPSTGLVPVGIIPWLTLTSQVSNFLCQKANNFVLAL